MIKGIIKVAVGVALGIALAFYGCMTCVAVNEANLLSDPTSPPEAVYTLEDSVIIEKAELTPDGVRGVLFNSAHRRLSRVDVYYNLYDADSVRIRGAFDKVYDVQPLESARFHVEVFAHEKVRSVKFDQFYVTE